jgi:hypothetical protein
MIVASLRFETPGGKRLADGRPRRVITASAEHRPLAAIDCRMDRPIVLIDISPSTVADAFMRTDPLGVSRETEHPGD